MLPPSTERSRLDRAATSGRLLVAGTRAVAWATVLLGSVLFGSVLVGCGVFWLTHPPDLPARVTEIAPRTGGPKERVEALVDDRGIPHLFGQSETDLAYALGFFHARDRQFQVLVLVHAAQGRLTELFGDDLLGADLTYRVLTYRLDDQVAAMSPRDRALVDAYLDGLNKGAEHAGPSAEMRLLRIDWEPLLPRDVISVIRLQSWGLSFDADEELGRSRILGRLPEGDTRIADLVKDVPHRGVPIVLGGQAPSLVPTDGGVTDEDGATDGGDDGTGPRTLPLPPPEDDGGVLPPLLEIPTVPTGPPPLTPEAARLHGLHLALAFLPGRAPKGASNSWVVSGRFTSSGAPILANDPHLRHLLPSMFYLAHLETPELRAVGATFPGIPAVVIGHTRHLAWGMTTSYTDTQDLVRIAVISDDDQRYLLDGQPRRFGQWVQRFVTDDDVMRTEVWKTTVFGPVLPESFDYLAEPGRRYALLWTGFDPALNQNGLSAFWDLYRAENLPEARAALERVGSPSQNVTLAFKDGTIAYHLLGAIPRRPGQAARDRPREGRTSDGIWTGFLDEAEKPSLEDPAAGYIVTANQRVTDEDGPKDLGSRAAPPHRAERIHALLGPLLARGKVTADELLALQQDVVSVEALRLAPILAAHCPASLDGYSDEAVAAFCTTLRTWDFRYDTLSLGALPFTWLLEALQDEVLGVHLGTDVAFQLRGDPATRLALEEAVLAEARGQETALFDDRRTSEREGLAGFVALAAQATMDRLDDATGIEPGDWRWGRYHILRPRGALAEVPVVGGQFALPWRPQSGHSSTVRAETGLPVQGGAVLRFVAEMTDPVQARFTLDLGQSGHIGHPHLDDQRDDWERGTPRPIPVEKSAIPLESHLVFLPGAGSQAQAAQAEPDLDGGPGAPSAGTGAPSAGTGAPSAGTGAPSAGTGAPSAGTGELSADRSGGRGPAAPPTLPPPPPRRPAAPDGGAR